MILLKQLKLKNFLSHSDTIIDFRPNQSILIDGKSGSGKSSLVESILFALYGIGRSSNNSALIKRGKEKLVINLILSDIENDIEYKIERSVTKKNKHELKIIENSKPVKTKGIRETQNYIEKNILHSSYLLFINSIIYKQDNTENFVKQTASTRKNILLEIIRASDYDEYLKKAKEELNKIKTSKEVILSKIEDRKNDIQNNKETADKLRDYEKEEERLKKEIDNLKIDFNKMTARQKEVQDLLSDMRVKNVQMESKLKEYDKKSSRIKELNQLIIEISNVKTEDITKELNELNEKKKQLADYNAAKDKVMEWTTQQTKFLNERPVEHDYETEIANLNKELIELMGEKLDQCPKCGYIDPEREKRQKDRVNTKQEQLVSTQAKFDAYKGQLSEYNKKIQELGPQPTLPLSSEQYTEFVAALEKFDELNRKLIEAENIKKKIEEYAAEIELIKAEQKDLSDEIKKIEVDVSKKDDIESEERQLKNDIVKINGKLEELMVLHTSNSQLLGVAKHAAKKIVDSEKELKQLKKDLEVDVISIEALEIVKDAFGPNGIRAIVIDYVIPQLEDKINNILGKLSDFRIKLETQKSGIGADVVLEGLFITIINDIGEEFEYENYSGGEKVKISMAINEALAEVSKIGFRVLDETIVALDNDSIQNFLLAMEEVLRKVNQVICISHIQEIKDMFDEKIIIQKTNGKSNIKI